MVRKMLLWLVAGALAVATAAPAFASQPPGQLGNEGQPGNQGGASGQPGN